MGERDHRLSPACAWWFRVNEADITFFDLIALAVFENQDFARSPMMAVYPGDSNLICDWLAEFPSVLMEQKIELLPTEGDRAAFQLRPEQWTDFLRRLGIDQDHEEQQEL